ncbi:MAG: PHP domain-containing protein [Anaerolineae bacterium]
MSNLTQFTADLHVHTIISDGLHTPASIVVMAQRLHLHALAITDHDAVEGVSEAQDAARGSDLLVVPGVELSAEAQDGEVHILGYFIDITNRNLNKILDTLTQARLVRAQNMLEKLDTLGLPLDWNKVQHLSGPGALGRPHIAEAMIQAGYVGSTQQAFSQYLGRGQAAYVPRFKLAPKEAISLIRDAGGLAVLAHPWYAQHLVGQLAGAGLGGVEAYYTGYSHDMSAALVRLANQHKLLCTGGSDFHGYERIPNNVLGGVSLPADCLVKFLAWRADNVPPTAVVS